MTCPCNYNRTFGTMISGRLAERYGLTSGDTLTLQTGETNQPVKLAGLLASADGRSQSALDGLILTDISTAQEVLAKVGRLSTIDLILPAGYQNQSIVELLPPNAPLQ